jgi:hypothetical protein
VTAYALLREGVVTAFTVLVNVFLAGLLAFNFFEPLAAALEPALRGSFLANYEDAFALVLVFAPAMVALRAAANSLVPAQIGFDALLEQAGATLVGLLTGYLLAGFLVCMLQTLPWHENFMGFSPQVETEEGASKLRRWLPPDRVWLGMMHRASAVAFSQADGPQFDPRGTFALRYARFRRYGEDREPLPSGGEADP